SGTAAARSGGPSLPACRGSRPQDSTSWRTSLPCTGTRSNRLSQPKKIEKKSTVRHPRTSGLVLVIEWMRLFIVCKRGDPVQRKRVTIFVPLLGLLLLGNGCGPASRPPSSAGEARPFDGVALRVACPDAVSAAIVRRFKPGWEHRTGATVEVVEQGEVE